MDFFEISNLPLNTGKKMPLIKDYNLNRSAGDFFDTFGENRKNLGLLIDKKRFLILVFFIFFVLILIFLRIIQLQIIQGDYYRFIADGNRIRIKRIQPKRGIVYDSSFRALLKNSPSLSLEVVPIDLPEDKDKLLELQEKLSEKLGGTELDLSEYISDNVLENFQPRIIKESLEYEQAMDLMISSKELKGISVIIDNKREYPYGYYLSHVLGYLGSISEEQYQDLKENGYYLDDKIGTSGLELSYENILRGEFGRKKIEVDSLGKEIKELAREDPMDGGDLILSLDLELQFKITNLLLGYLKRLNLRKANVVAIDPRNGSILSLVSIPSFDNNLFSSKISVSDYQNLVNDPDEPMFFRAISGEYPPGSTFKIIMAAAALEEGVIDEDTNFLSSGGIWVSKWFFPDWKEGGHGFTNIKRALAHSVNTFFYTIGGGYKEFQGLGLNGINSYARKFGLSQNSGIDLSNEFSGFLPTEKWKQEVKGESWYIGDTYHLSIGQGDILVTPLQVAMFTSVIANNGTLYSPRLLKSVFYGQDRKFVEPFVKNTDFVSKENISIIQSGLRLSVVDGSCRYLLTLPVKTAGKTGTAQYGSGNKTHAWFTGYAPYDNPEIVLTILIEGGGEGSSVAVPLARDILLWYFKDRKEVNVVK